MTSPPQTSPGEKEGTNPPPSNSTHTPTLLGASSLSTRAQEKEETNPPKTKHDVFHQRRPPIPHGGTPERRTDRTALVVDGGAKDTGGGGESAGEADGEGGGGDGAELESSRAVGG